MERKVVFLIGGMFAGVLTPLQAFDGDLDSLYGDWCLTGMSKELSGELIPDRANYTFTQSKQLKYDAGIFKQEDDFTIDEDKINTESMGNYKIISIEEHKMILNYGGFMHFDRGKCE